MSAVVPGLLLMIIELKPIIALSRCLPMPQVVSKTPEIFPLLDTADHVLSFTPSLAIPAVPIPLQDAIDRHRLELASLARSVTIIIQPGRDMVE
ncbi:MAG: hypothetical protein WA996_24760 [Candidatus Promineifilaceae bacterium]